MVKQPQDHKIVAHCSMIAVPASGTKQREGFTNDAPRSIRESTSKSELPLHADQAAQDSSMSSRSARSISHGLGIRLPPVNSGKLSADGAHTALRSERIVAISVLGHVAPTLITQIR